MSRPREPETTLRDLIAIGALAAYPHLLVMNQPETVAASVYRLADAMLAEKAKSKEARQICPT